MNLSSLRIVKFNLIYLACVIKMYNHYHGSTHPCSCSNLTTIDIGLIIVGMAWVEVIEREDGRHSVWKCFHSSTES